MTALSAQPVTPDDLGIDDLKELLRSVNQTTERLEETHSALHRQVAKLKGELAEANAQLRRSRDLAALGEMAAGIAHEVRNPLGSIQLYVQVLADDLSGRPALREVCEKISQAVGGLDAVVHDVLQFARDTVIRPTPTSAGELFDRALIVCESLLGQGAVEVVRGPGGGCRLVADVALMSQALGNVIRNAVEAMREQPAGPNTLTLSAARRTVRCPDGTGASRVVLGVQDAGPGIPDAARERMFNPFFTTRATGTGLGLAIVHRIVDAHGGIVSIGNRPEGGARVDLCLPPEPAIPPADVERGRAAEGSS